MATKKTVDARKSFIDLIPEPEVKKEYIESLGQEIYFKELSAADQDSYEWSIVEFVDDPNNPDRQKLQRNMDAMRAKYLVRSICDEDGNRLLGDDEYEVIGRKKSSVIAELHQAALKVNRATEPEKAEQEKKLDTTTEGGSSSD
jgi:hypothetical protein